MRNTKENIHPSDELLASKPDARRNDNFNKHSELFKQITTEIPTIFFEDKIAKSARASSEFFGFDVNPSEGCVKRAVDIYNRMEKIGLTGFEPVVIPNAVLARENKLWEKPRIIRPDSELFGLSNIHFYPKPAPILDESILLFDGRANPEEGNSYPDDKFIEGLMRKVLSKGGSRRHHSVFKQGEPDNMRAGTHPGYLYHAVLPEINSLIGEDVLAGAEVRLPRAAEVMVAVNTGSRFGQSSSSEWLADYFVVKDVEDVNPNVVDHMLVYAGQVRNGVLPLGFCKAKSQESYDTHTGWRPVIAVSNNK